MDHKFYACPPIAGTHEGWLVDGECVRLTFPTRFEAGFKLTVSFAYRPQRVYAIIGHTIDGQYAKTMELATYEEPCSSLK